MDEELLLVEAVVTGREPSGTTLIDARSYVVPGDLLFANVTAAMVAAARVRRLFTEAPRVKLEVLRVLTKEEALGHERLFPVARH